MPEIEACPNCSDKLRDSDLHGKQRPLFRLYMRENLPGGKRRWVVVGDYCPHCHYFRAVEAPKFHWMFLQD